MCLLICDKWKQKPKYDKYKPETKNNFYLHEGCWERDGKKVEWEHCSIDKKEMILLWI